MALRARAILVAALEEFAEALISLLDRTIREVLPSFRFRTITGDADDDAFADCAIVADADFIITGDRHFDAMRGSGYKPRPRRNSSGCI